MAYGGFLILKDKLIVSSGNVVSGKGKPFYFDRVNHAISYEHDNHKGVFEANTIITESSYTTDQKEFITRLNWFQMQKLRWMFRRHWLQNPSNVIHIAIICLIFTLAFVGFEYIHRIF